MEAITACPEVANAWLAILPALLAFLEAPSATALIEATLRPISSTLSLTVLLLFKAFVAFSLAFSAKLLASETWSKTA